MIRMKEMDEAVTLREQMGQETGPVVLINIFTVQPEEADQLLEAWAADAARWGRIVWPSNHSSTNSRSRARAASHCSEIRSR